MLLVILILKRYEFLFGEVLKFIPNHDAVLKMNFGQDYDVQVYLRENTPGDATILAYGGLVYYSNRDIVLIDSYKMAGTYDFSVSSNSSNYSVYTPLINAPSIQDSMNILDNYNISYILYKNPSWDEYVYGIDALYEQSVITKNLNNSNFLNSYIQILNLVYIVLYINKY